MPKPRRELFPDPSRIPGLSDSELSDMVMRGRRLDAFMELEFHSLDFIPLLEELAIGAAVGSLPKPGEAVAKIEETAVASWFQSGKHETVTDIRAEFSRWKSDASSALKEIERRRKKA